jgi:hypothetical protein
MPQKSKKEDFFHLFNVLDPECTQVVYVSNIQSLIHSLNLPFSTEDVNKYFPSQCSYTEFLNLHSEFLE